MRNGTGPSGGCRFLLCGFLYGLSVFRGLCPYTSVSARVSELFELYRTHANVSGI